MGSEWSNSYGLGISNESMKQGDRLKKLSFKDFFRRNRFDLIEIYKIAKVDY